MLLDLLPINLIHAWRTATSELRASEVPGLGDAKVS